MLEEEKNKQKIILDQLDDDDDDDDDDDYFDNSDNKIQYQKPPHQKTDDQLQKEILQKFHDDGFQSQARPLKTIKVLDQTANFSYDYQNVMHGSKKKKKKRKTLDYDNQIGHLQNLDQGDKLVPRKNVPDIDDPTMNEIDLAIKLAKRPKTMYRSRKMDQGELNCQTEIHQAEKIVKNMFNLAKQDRIAFKEKAPAFYKLKQLKNVCNQLRIVKLHESLLNADLCKALNQWLLKYDKKTPQNITLVRDIIKIIDQLPIDVKQHLTCKQCDLGRRIKELSFYEDSEIKRIASKIFDKWSRQIFDTNIDYAGYQQEQGQYKRFIENKRQKDRWMKLEKEKERKRQLQENKQAEDQAKAEQTPESLSKERKLRSIIPQKASFDYINRPKIQKAPQSFQDKKVDPASSQGILMNILSKSSKMKRFK